MDSVRQFDFMAADGSRDISRAKVHKAVTQLVADKEAGRITYPNLVDRLIEITDELGSEMYDQGYSEAIEDNF